MEVHLQTGIDAGTPTNIYLLKVNNRNTRKKVWNKFKVNYKNTRTTSFDVVLVFLLLTFNIFHTFFLVFLLFYFK